MDRTVFPGAVATTAGIILRPSRNSFISSLPFSRGLTRTPFDALRLSLLVRQKLLGLVAFLADLHRWPCERPLSRGDQAPPAALTCFRGRFPWSACALILRVLPSLSGSPSLSFLICMQVLGPLQSSFVSQGAPVPRRGSSHHCRAFVGNLAPEVCSKGKGCEVCWERKSCQSCTQIMF